MKLLTKEIEKKILPLRATDGKPDNERKIAVKFFNPCGAWTFYAVEGERQGDDFIFYGWVDGVDYPEWGKMSLNEMSAIKLRFGLGIERDRHFDNKRISDIKGA